MQWGAGEVTLLPQNQADGDGNADENNVDKAASDETKQVHHIT